MKKLLIISPSFPPINAADMQRVRQSIPYFQSLGWEPTVVAVDPIFNEHVQDPILVESLVHVKFLLIWIKAFSTKWTRKIGLGSLGLRSLWHYKKEIDRLLKDEKYDLIYFSTTMFPVMILGAYWKKKFGVKYVIDMQDPWFSNYYIKKPKNERPNKFWISYYINKFLEPIAMNSVDGLIAVSQKYLDDLSQRYINVNLIKKETIPFGAVDMDFKILENNDLVKNTVFSKQDDYIYISYVGRGGHDMSYSFVLFCEAISLIREHNLELFNKLKCHFVGTSYAPKNMARPYFTVLAEKYDLTDFYQEHPVRVPYFEGLKILQESDLLFIPGSDDPGYTASKIYPYILSQKPLLAVFNHQSSVKNVIHEANTGVFIGFDNIEKIPNEQLVNQIYHSLLDLLQNKETRILDQIAFHKYMAASMTKRQTDFFDQIVLDKN